MYNICKYFIIEIPVRIEHPLSIRGLPWWLSSKLKKKEYFISSFLFVLAAPCGR